MGERIELLRYFTKIHGLHLLYLQHTFSIKDTMPELHALSKMIESKDLQLSTNISYS